MLTELIQRISNGGLGTADVAERKPESGHPPDPSTASPIEEPDDGIEVQNVVASTSLDREIDLEALSDDLPNSEFDPGSFPGIVYRPSSPKSTLLLFRSGTITVTGASRVEAVDPAVEALLDDLDALGIPVPEEPTVTIQNIVSSADLRQNLNLDLIALGLGLEDVEYEPEQFPGLIYRLDEPSVVLLLFASGKVVIAGGQSRSDADRAVAVIKSELDDLGMLD